MKYPFTYKIFGYIDGENRYYEQYGIGFCTGYADAAKQIEETYADELITIKHLEIFEERTLLPMSKKMVEGIVSEFVYGNETYETEITQAEARKI